MFFSKQFKDFLIKSSLDDFLGSMLPQYMALCIHFVCMFCPRHETLTLRDSCHSCWMKSRIKEVAPDLTVNQAGISSLIDLVKAIADSDVTIEEHE